MNDINLKVYGPILKTRPAWRFDIGAFLMRFIPFLATVGVVSMLTLVGYSTLLAGTVASVGAFSTFFFGPRVGRLIDQKGQSKVMPGATALGMVGLVIVLVVTFFHLPFWLYYPAEVLMGFIPHAPSIARTRWTYLLKGSCYSDELKNVEIQQVFSYEGVLDDLAFMIAPAIAVALNVMIHPIAGLLVGGLCYVAGAVLMLSSKDTEPTVGWGTTPQPEKGVKQRSVFFEYSPVAVCVFILFFVGCMFGVVDTAVVQFSNAIGMPTFASVAMAIGSLASMAAGIVFGAIKLPTKLYKQLVVVAVLFGLIYGCMIFVDIAPTYLVVNTLASFFYAPLIILSNTTVEKSVDASRLTEGITMVNAGLIVGMAIGPTLGGAVIDTRGVFAGLDTVGICALLIVAIALACMRVLKKGLDKAE